MSGPRFIFLDIETTGLDSQEHSIIEIGAVATDDRLVVVGTPFQAVLRAETTRNWDPWCLEQHAKTGLLEEEARAPHASGIAAALQAWVGDLGVTKATEVAGASVHFDMKFFSASPYFNWLQGVVSHRFFDVSSLRTAAKLGGFEASASMVKTKEAAPHRVLGDIALDIQHAKNFLDYVQNLKGDLEWSQQR